MSTATFRPSDRVDFIVIGSGAAGGVLAKELSTAGFKVVVLEQGPYLRETDFVHDEIKGFFQGQLLNNWKRQPNTFRRTASDKASQQPAVLYGRVVGGGTVHFTGNFWRFKELDFRERTRWGSVSGADLQDWPISYSELEPYYTKVEQEFGVSGLSDAPFDPPRSQPYPLPPLPVKSSGILFERATRKLGLHPYPAPMAILSKPYRGRSACMQCSFCKGFGCEVGAKSSSLASVIPVAEKTGRCEIRPNSYVRKIEIDGRGRVTGAIYFDSSKKEIFQRAKAVIVCANGAETPRLLLMSKSNRFPNGLANTNGVVGRYFLGDTGATLQGLFEHPLNDYHGVHVSRLIHDFYDSDPKRGFYGGAGIDARFDQSPIGFALWGLPRNVPRWGEGFKSALGRYFTHSMSLFAHTTCLAMESNTIDLDPDVKDEWGLPAVRMTFKNHPDDLKVMAFCIDRMREILQTAGAVQIWGGGVGDISFSAHLMGTCRMGNDPRTSVTDKFHRTHDVRNLFLVDGSSFVTCARQQPTCTIAALAYRAAGYIARSAKKGEI